MITKQCEIFMAKYFVLIHNELLKLVHDTCDSPHVWKWSHPMHHNRYMWPRIFGHLIHTWMQYKMECDFKFEEVKYSQSP
jgi:hypothetical protein